MAAEEVSDKLLSVAQAARALGVSPTTIRRACDAGVLLHHRSPGGHRRIAASALAKVPRDKLQRAGGRRASVADEAARVAVELVRLAESEPGLHELALGVAGRLLEVTGAVDCDIFLRLGQVDVPFRCVVSLEAGGEDESVRGYSLRTDVYGTVRRLIDERLPVLISDRDDPALATPERELLERYDYGCELEVPLVIRESVVGVIDLYGDRPYALDASVDLVGSVADAVAPHLEKALLVDELERRNQVLGELLELAGMLSQTYDVEELLRTVGKRLIWAVHAGHCDIYRREADGYRCVVSAARDGFVTPYEGEWFDEERHPARASALREGRLLVIDDVEDSAVLTRREKKSLLADGLESELCIPLLTGGEIIGFIDLFDARPRDWKDCSGFAAGVGQLVAGGLENARLLSDLETRNAELRTLVEGSLEFGSTLDTERVLFSIAVRMQEATGAAAVDICTVRGRSARVVASVDADGRVAADLGREFAIADQPLVREALEGQAVVVEDVFADPRATTLERRDWATFGLRAGIVVPLTNGAEVVGVAGIYDREPRVFSHVDLLRGLGQVAGQAIVNARLYQELARGARRATLLNEVGAELSAELDRDRLLGTLVRRLRAVTESSGATAYLVDGDGLRRIAVAADGAPGLGATAGERIGLGDRPLTRLVAETGRPAAIADLDDAERDSAGRAWLREHGLRSYLVAPLFAKGEVVGMVELVDTAADRAFSRDEIGLVEAVCRVAGLAVDNALLFADRARRTRETELLNEIARRTAASLDLKEIAEAAVEGLRGLFEIDGSSLTLREDAEWVTVHGGKAGQPWSAHAQDADRLAAAVRRERVVVDRGDGGDPAAGHGAAGHPSVTIGLFDGEDVVGLLTLAGRGPHARADADKDLLERVGVHLSLAAHNARLYAEIKNLHLSNLKGLSTALNAKDYYTLGHAARVAAYIVLLGEELGWGPDAVERVRDAAYLHDIGKIGVSDRVLLKQGPLNDEEWELMRQHPAVSADIIRPLFATDLVDAVRHHHERYDGKGYPDGLAGEEIPELARALCVADSYDAMSLQRPYRSALTSDQCLVELDRCSGEQFDPVMVAAFKRVLARLAARRKIAVRAAAEAADLIDPAVHAELERTWEIDGPDYARIQAALRQVRDAYAEVRFLTTQMRRDKRCVIVADAEETGSVEHSPLGEEVMVDEAPQQVLSGDPVTHNVLFVDNFGVWVNGIVPLVRDDGEISAVVVADVPALGATGALGFARMTGETPVSTLQEAAVRLSRAEIEAITDGLTGLYNHRHLHEALSEHVARALQDGSPLSVLFCDLDLFKDFNDRFGHAAGDAALRATARIIENCTRRADLAARYGGEEFVVLLPGASRAEATAIADRIRATIASRYRADGGLTMSIGLATFPEDATEKAALLETADRAMYEAKRLGRDRIAAGGA